MCCNYCKHTISMWLASTSQGSELNDAEQPAARDPRGEVSGPLLPIPPHSIHVLSSSWWLPQKAFWHAPLRLSQQPGSWTFGPFYPSVLNHSDTGLDWGPTMCRCVGFPRRL